jgi:hypothetical protein
MKFDDPVLENDYRDLITAKTLTFCRISWGMVIFLGVVFAAMDGMMFGEKAVFVRIARLIISLVALIFLTGSWFPVFKKFLFLSSSIFIFVLSSFCTILMVMGDNTSFNPYFLGLFFGYAGIFTTVGMGYRASFLSMILSFVFFDAVLFLTVKTSLQILMLYHFFLPGIMLVFGYAGYLVEKMSRDNFVTSRELQESMENVKQLSGLLPICSVCKKVRDDKGYWSQIESYITAHSEAGFTHGYCPECAKKIEEEISQYHLHHHAG